MASHVDIGSGNGKVEMEEFESPLFRQSCRNCDFCDGLREETDIQEKESSPDLSAKSLLNSLPFLDRYLAVFILLAMISGVLIGVYQNDRIQDAFNGGSQFQGTSIPILIGLLVMMWPILTKVQYERLPSIFKQRRIWIHILVSIVLNWIIAPLV
ncbi:hypothetical protein FRB91_002376, partial [Serendipita sp. 411]